MWWGLIVILGGAACAGCAAVFQALAARAIPDAGAGLRLGLVVDLFRQWRFLLGIGLDLCSFAAATVALRVLPVFLVQTAVAANLAVTAVVAWLILGTRLRWQEIAAISVVCVGLAGLGASAAPQSPQHGTTALHVGLLGAVVAIGLLGMVGARLPGRWNGAVLGLLAGCAFGSVNLCSRMLPNFSPSVLIAEPTFWAIPLAGLCALLFFNTAVQRESVVAASAGTILGQTVYPASIGLTELGDHSQPGLAPLAIAGFVMAIAGALLLTRFGDLSRDGGGRARSVHRRGTTSGTRTARTTPSATPGSVTEPSARPPTDS